MLYYIDDQRKMKYLDERDMLRNVETLSEFILRMKNRNNTRNTNSNKVEKMENHLKIMKLSIGRCAAAAESFGVLQIELKIKKHISVVLRHISENLRFNYEKHRRELEELKTFLGKSLINNYYCRTGQGIFNGRECCMSYATRVKKNSR